MSGDSVLQLRPVPNVVLLPCRTQMNLARQWHDDSTAAVSNVEPNAVAPNSKDKTNHPSSGIAPSKMAEGNLNEEREKFVLFKTILNARRQRRRMQQSILNTVIARRGLLLKVFSFILLLVSLDESQQVTVLRSCRRFQTLTLSNLLSPSDSSSLKLSGKTGRFVFFY